jgi:amidohydrolase
MELKYKELVENNILDLKDKIVAWRRDLHMHPELSFQEKRTSAIITKELERLGLDINQNVGGTGVTAILHIDSKFPTVALRADMDAISITELSDCQYRSLTPGIMHACGHDGHVSALLGAAIIIANNRSVLTSNVKFIFQPAEEDIPGGAKKMIEEGCLEDVNVIFGGHLNSSLQFGTAKCSLGLALGLIGKFEIEITGEGTHSGYPHLGNDTILTAAHIIVNLQSVASRILDVTIPKVISVCQIHGGEHDSATPRSVIIKGMYASLCEEQRTAIEDNIQQQVELTCKMFGTNGRVIITPGCPPLINDYSMAFYTRSIIESYLGKDGLHEVSPNLGWEDFSFYLQKIPGAMFFLGSSNKNKGIGGVPHHHPKFDIDEDSILMMAKLYSSLALEFNK